MRKGHVVPKRGRRPRRLAMAAAWLGGIVVIVAVAGIPVYIYPPSDSTYGVDAVLVLGPPTGNRIDRAREISDQNGGASIIVSVSPRGQHSSERTKACRSADVECLIPDPFTTKGEAELLSELAAEYGWGSAAVVTEAPQVLRARYVFDRCSRLDTSVVSVPYSGSFFGLVYQYGYQTAAFAKAFTTGCA